MNGKDPAVAAQYVQIFFLEINNVYTLCPEYRHCLNAIRTISCSVHNIQHFFFMCIYNNGPFIVNRMVSWLTMSIV